MKLKTSVIAVLTAIFASSCNDGQDSRPLTEVKVDFDKKEIIKVDDKQIVSLETLDNSLLFDICNVKPSTASMLFSLETF